MGCNLAHYPAEKADIIKQRVNDIFLEEYENLKKDSDEKKRKKFQSLFEDYLQKDNPGNNLGGILVPDSEEERSQDDNDIAGRIVIEETDEEENVQENGKNENIEDDDETQLSADDLNKYFTTIFGC